MWRREEHTDTMMNFEDLVQQQKSPSTPSSVITSTTAGDPDVKLGLGLLGDAASGPKPGGGAREADANCQQRQREDASFFQELADLIDQKGVSGGIASSSLLSITKDPTMASPPTQSTSQRAMMTSAAAAATAALSSSTSQPSQLSLPCGFKPSTASLLRSWGLLGSLMLDIINGFMFLVDGDGRVLVTSENVEAFLGRSIAEVEGLPVYGFLHQDDHARFRSEQVDSASGSPPPTIGGGGGGGGNRGQQTVPKVFNCRFRRSRRNGNSEEAYESLQVSVVQVKPRPFRTGLPQVIADGKDLSECRMFCVARKMGEIERSRHIPVQMFTTKLDPIPPNLGVIAVDTTGMNTMHTTAMTKVLLQKSLLSLCHAEDRVSLNQHINLCLRETGGISHISPVYRIRLLDGPHAGWVRIKTKSKFFKPSPAMGNPRGFINSVHTILDMTELRYNDENDGLLMAVTGEGESDRLTPQQRQQQQQQQPPAGNGGNNNNNTIQSKTSPPPSGSQLASPPSSSSTDEAAQQKNLLLKQLLNVNFSRGESAAAGVASAMSQQLQQLQQQQQQQQQHQQQQQQQQVKQQQLQQQQQQQQQPQQRKTLQATSLSGLASNSGILKLLSQHMENVPRTSPPNPEDAQPPLAGVKRSASGSLLSPSSSVQSPEAPSPGTGESSSVCKQNPALISLLSKPTTNAVSVPPPVPTKWHQEPREKFSRTEEGMKKFLPPHPAERAGGRGGGARSPVTTTATATVLQPRIQQASSSTSGPAASNPSSSSATSTSGSAANQILDVCADDMLNEILEGVIDFQDTNPEAAGPHTAPAPPPTASLSTAFGKNISSKIEDIEKYLVGPAAAAAPAVSSSGSFQHQRHHSGPLTTMSGTASSYPPPIQTMASSSSSSSVAASNNNQQQQLLQQQQLARRQNSAPALVATSGGGGRGPGGSPVALVPRMNELLQGVPPNVSIPDCPDLDSIVMLQQRRRMSSGGSAPPLTPNGNSSRLQLSQRLTSPTVVSMASSAAPPGGRVVMGGGGGVNQLLMQQLNAGPMNGRQHQMQPPQQYGPGYNNLGSYRMQQQRYLPPTSGNQQQQHMHQQQQQAFQGSLNQQRAMMMGQQQGYLNRPQQQQQQQLQQQQPQQPHHAGGGGEPAPSLLQQLLSE